MEPTVNGLKTPEILEIRARVGTGTDLHTKVDGVKTKTDNLPANTGTILGTPANTSISGDLAAIDTLIDGIKAKTDNLPANTGTILGTPANTSISGDLAAIDTLIDGIKAKTDNLPANTSTTVGTPEALGGGTASVAGMLVSLAGAGFASTDCLKDIKSAILAIENNTSFSASIVPVMEKPENYNLDYQVTVIAKNGVGGLEDPDLNLMLMKYVAVDGSSRNSNLFINDARETAATKIAIHTITDPTIHPTDGATYTSPNGVTLTVIGMIGVVTLVSSWTGGTAPNAGTLTKTGGTGDNSLTSSAVDTSWASMLRDSAGEFSAFYNVTFTDTKESLAARFKYYESGTVNSASRSTCVVDYETTAGVASALWDEATSTHTTSGTFGKLVKDAAGATFDTSTDSNEALRNRIDVLVGTPANTSISGDLAAIDTLIDGIKAKTDNLPANTGTSLTNLQSAVDVIDGYMDVPTADATTDTTIRDVVGRKTDAAVVAVGTTKSLQAYSKGILTTDLLIKAKTDNLPANTSTVLGTPAASLAADLLVVDGYFDVPTADATTDATIRDVVGRKTDAGVVVVGTTKSIQAYVKGVLTTDLAIKTKTDNLPANTSTTLGTPAGASISADVAAVKVDTAAIKTKTDNLPANTGTSLTTLQSAVDVIDGYFDVPTADAATDTTIRDVLGRKTDTGVVVVGTTKSVQAYVKGILTTDLLIKAKTDNLPANTSTTLGTPAGASISADLVTIDTVVDGIKTKTDNLPANTSTTLGTPAGASISADIAAVKVDTAAIKTKTDNLPANTGTSLTTLQSAVDVIDGYFDVPTADVTTDTTMRDVIGRKTDAAVVVVGTTKSIQAYVKGVLTTDLLIKAKTDNLPANTSTTLGTPAGASISADLVTIDTVVDGIAAKTVNLPANTGTSLTNLQTAVDAISQSKPFLATANTGNIAQAGHEAVNLGTAQGFKSKNANIKRLNVTVLTGATSNFDVEIFEDSGEVNSLVLVEDVSASGLFLALDELFINQNGSTSANIYVRITNNADVGVSTFKVVVRGMTLLDTLA